MSQPVELVLAEPLAVGSILRRSAPRVVRDGLGPIASFFVGWKLAGLAVGIGFAAVLALVLYRRERRLGRPAIIVRVALGLVLLRAVVGLISGNTTLYLGQEVIIDLAIGLTVLGSLVIKRPLAQIFAQEIYSFPSQVYDSETLRRTFRLITFVWGAYFLARSVVRLAAILTLSTEQYLLVAAISDGPFLVGLLAWSIFYTTRRFRQSEEWGAAIALAEQRAA
jgi:intracellular septation protein A